MGSDPVSLNPVLDNVDKLDLEDQQYLQEIICRRLTDAKRAALVRRAKQARGNVRKNQCRIGSAHDLLANLDDYTRLGRQGGLRGDDLILSQRLRTDRRFGLMSVKVDRVPVKYSITSTRCAASDCLICSV